MLPIQPRTAVLISILIPAPIVKTAAGHQFGSFMDSSQQKLYDEYLKQLDSLDQKLNDSQT